MPRAKWCRNQQGGIKSIQPGVLTPSICSVSAGTLTQALHEHAVLGQEALVLRAARLSPHCQCLQQAQCIPGVSL